MTALYSNLLNDEAGFIVSAELILVSTIAVLGLVVGLGELALNVNNELEDVGSAFAHMKQSYWTNGNCGHGGTFWGSSYWDQAEFCDDQFDIQ